MKIKRSRLKTYHHRRKSLKKDSEGNTYTDYGAATSFTAELWPGSGKLQAELYGERLSNIRNLRLEGPYTITADSKDVVHYVFEDGPDIVEGDGLCLDVGPDRPPDYKIIAVKHYKILRLEAEKI